MSGFITMQRDALDHPLLKDGDKFRAWFWLIAKACWKPTRVDIGGRIITLERGQLCYSIRYLADAWGWPRTTVDRFLRRLEGESMLTVTRSKTGTGGGTAQIIITVENYSKYQDAGEHTGTADGTEAGQQRDSSGTNKNKGNKGNKASSIEEATPLPPKPKKKPAEPKPKPEARLPWHNVPEWVPLDAWHRFLKHRIEIKRQVTENTAPAILDKLDGLRANGHDPGQVLDQTVINKWTDIFEIKDRNNGNRNSENRTRGSDQRSTLARVIDQGIDNLDRIERAQEGIP